uniref:Putative conserved plasma membrane protein n=1 Tax=Lutzomyia longipalpis TaxID=7200 RepID=A0A7G3AGQ2_LUTLO
MRQLMGRTPGIIKSKFLSVIGSSNEIFNGISSKLEALSLSSSTETSRETEDEYDIFKPQPIPKKTKASPPNSTGLKEDEEDDYDDYMIDFEARRVKERRAHEEILSGRYRHPNIIPRISAENHDMADLNHHAISSSISTDMSNCSIDSKSLHVDEENDDAANNADGGQVLKSTHEQFHPAIDIQAPSERVTPIEEERFKPDASSISTSEYDLCLPSGGGSCESSDLKVWMRSESVNSVPSWASSISLDSQSEEVVLEFMRRFLTALFDNSCAISLELKSEFGQMARTEAGRLWFSRLVNAQRVKSKMVDETTFYSLVQYFAIVLFECHESEDFSPAKSLMNMCFTFYHDITVPGIEPYREYLYIYLRDQPIWHSLRFWNAAFFDALQCERAHRPVPQTKRSSTTQKDSSNGTTRRNTATPQRDRSQSISSATNEEIDEEIKLDIKEDVLEEKNHLFEITEDVKFQQNITFGQLGTFTCNMHAFGLSKQLCLEFLRKQCTIANLSKEDEKLLRDNINRMYRETERWSEAQESLSRMNYNANASARQPSGVRKPKRVSDTNAMGPAAPLQGAPQFMSTPQQPYGMATSTPTYAPQNPSPQQQFQMPQQQQQQNYGFDQNINQSNYSQYPGGNFAPGQQPQAQQMPFAGAPGGQPGGFPGQFSMLQQPIVQDMAMQYGQRLADQGKELVNREFEKYIPVTRLKYYFAVDNRYVINKLSLLFFPFTHTDWSLKYDQDSPVQPRYDVNAPDLYIPTMAYITYIVLAGLALGMQDRFSPEQLGILASSALAYSIFELIIYSVTLYVANISTSLKTLDLLAFSGYKYTIINFCILVSILFRRSGYYAALAYCSFSLAFFLLRNIKAKVLSNPQTAPVPGGYDPYGNQQQFDQTMGHKRKLYFLLLVAALQPLLAFWLSWHLIPSVTLEVQ